MWPDTSEVVEPLDLPLKLLNDVSQAGDTGKLGKHHHGKLLPSIEAPILPFASEAFALDPVENMSVNKLQQLAKNCVTMCHGLILLWC